MCYLIASQRSAPNSPQWFNTGLHWAYGIEGPAQGHWYVDPVTEKDMQSVNAYEHPQPHACFIQSVSDSLVGDTSSIMGLWNREALLFKFGSGTGSNFSNIRGAGEPLSGGGTSSGLLSFLKIGDRAAGAIKSGGTTRRAAKMVTLDLDHPDIEEYIGWKLTEEEKVSALVAGTAALQKHCNAVLEACWDGDDVSVDPTENPELNSAMVKAMRASVPNSHVQRMLDLAKQGWKSVEFEPMDTHWQGEGYATVSGQNSVINVLTPPNSGILTSQLSVCSDDLTIYDLSNQLAGQDLTGFWLDANGFQQPPSLSFNFNSAMPSGNYTYVVQSAVCPESVEAEGRGA